MIPAEVDSRLMAYLALGVAWFTAGASALAVEFVHVVAAQVNDSLLVGVALLALSTGTAIFAWVFKLLLDVRTSQTRSEEQVKEHDRRLTHLEEDR